MNQPSPIQPRTALHQAMANQQAQVDRLTQENQGLRQFASGLMHTVAKQGLAIDFIASVADLGPRIASIYRQADAANPAQPVPDPAGQPPTQTTEEAATPETMDNPLIPGQTPGSVQHLPADATGTPMDPGTTLPTAPYTNLVDVTAPVEGTQTHVPNDQTRTEVDVRVGDPMNPQRAFPWTGNNGPDAMGAQSSLQQTHPGLDSIQTQAQNTVMASIHLARLRLQAGTAASENDFEEAGRIQADAAMTPQIVDQEIAILQRTVQAQRTASQAQPRPAGAVPRPPAAQHVARTAPSLVSAPQQPQMVQRTAAVGSIEAAVEDSDLFLD